LRIDGAATEKKSPCPEKYTVLGTSGVFDDSHAAAQKWSNVSNPATLTEIAVMFPTPRRKKSRAATLPCSEDLYFYGN